MMIKGMGNIAKKEISSILSKEGLATLKEGELSWEEAASLYKIKKVEEKSKIGKFADLFQANYSRIPENLQEELSPENLAALVDAFYTCYGEAKAACQNS